MIINESIVKPRYKVYKAIMNQAGGAAPTVSIIENSIGNIVWTRTGVGSYTGTLTGAFPSGKVPNLTIPVAPLDGDAAFLYIGRGGTSNTIAIVGVEVSASGVNFPAGQQNSDSLIVDVLIEIKVLL